MRKESCSTCKFFRKLRGEDTEGFCLRYPPRPYYNERFMRKDEYGHTYGSGWIYLNPEVPEELWCGEYKEKDNE